MPSSPPDDVVKLFLSYAREDFDAVSALYDRLEALGLHPWMDKRDLLPGQRWRDVIARAVKQSDLVLVCLSSQSVDKRGFFQSEIRSALDAWQEKRQDDIYLIPVRLAACEVPEEVGEFNWVNLYEKDGWKLLLRAIEAAAKRIGRTVPVELTKALASGQKLLPQSPVDTPSEQVVQPPDPKVTPSVLKVAQGESKGNVEAQVGQRTIGGSWWLLAGLAVVVVAIATIAYMAGLIPPGQLPVSAVPAAEGTATVGAIGGLPTQTPTSAAVLSPTRGPTETLSSTQGPDATSARPTATPATTTTPSPIATATPTSTDSPTPTPTFTWLPYETALNCRMSLTGESDTVNASLGADKIGTQEVMWQKLVVDNREGFCDVEQAKKGRYRLVPLVSDNILVKPLEGEGRLQETEASTTILALLNNFEIVLPKQTDSGQNQYLLEYWGVKNDKIDWQEVQGGLIYELDWSITVPATPTPTSVPTSTPTSIGGGTIFPKIELQTPDENYTTDASQVTFGWTGTIAQLPKDACFEVVFWKDGENASTATAKVAATSTCHTFSYDIDISSLEPGVPYRWDVLVVQSAPSPYVRLTTPTGGRLITYTGEANTGDNVGGATGTPSP